MEGRMVERKAQILREPFYANKILLGFDDDDNF
jgi:hypothetical protein